MAGNSFQQQVLNVAEDLAQSVTVPLLGFLWSWIKRIIPLFIVLVVLVSLGLSAYTFFRQQRDRQLKFSVSSGKSSGAEQADLIEKKLREKQDLLGPNYLVTEVSTAGSLDNLRNVKRDQDGSTIGLTIEGLSIDKNDKQDIYTLVPLQWCYLHFVCSNDSLETLGFSAKSIQPIKLSEWAINYLKTREKYVQPGGKPHTSSDDKKWPIRLYLGQANSGTRQIAEMVLKNAKLPLSELEPSEFIADVEEVPEQLFRERIDGAFIIEPLQSPLIERIAADKQFQSTLISIDQIKDLLPNNHFLKPSQIPPYSYSFPQPFEGANSHLGAIETLATRRLIVASSKMSNRDAYLVANFIQAALPNDEVSRPDKDGHWLGPNNSDSGDFPPNYELHPGVVFDSKREPGINWFGRNVSWIGPLLLAMSISLITELKNRIPSWLDGHQPPVPPTDDTVEDRPQPPPAAPAAGQDQSANGRHDKQPTGYSEIESQLDALYDELMAAYDGDKKPSKAELTAWKERLDILMRYVRPLRREGKLSRNDVEALHGTASKLQRILELLRESSFADSTVGVGSKQNAGDGRGKGGRRAK